MSAQRYKHPVAIERMAHNLCPECGESPESHARVATISVMFAPCNLLAYGVIERIAQYRSDAITGAAS